jgi:hypothetical protein
MTIETPEPQFMAPGYSPQVTTIPLDNFVPYTPLDPSLHSYETNFAKNYIKGFTFLVVGLVGTIT